MEICSNKRTIQSDLRWLENNGFIVTQKNKTYKGKQTKNSYIVNLEKEKGYHVKILGWVLLLLQSKIMNIMF